MVFLIGTKETICFDVEKKLFSELHLFLFFEQAHCKFFLLSILLYIDGREQLIEHLVVRI